ncbi:MAG: 1-acyl-sn-glycerol-3-phosphate acyltransferase [Flavobacteriales bacterium]|nr:1-acyl-sn-glycerol-3-phosphate acyltransferase [Flavobacteriales bacterium]
MEEDHLEVFDADLARKVAKLFLPILEFYHRAKWIGLENIPDEVFLGVGNHTGMHFMPESLLWVAKYQSERRTVPMLTLIHHMTHRLATMGRLPVNELGFLEAKRENALDALRTGYSVMVYPGGDRDVARTYADRHKINFFDHLGYVKMALKAQVPILPIVGCGGGETAFVLNSGEKIAEVTGLKKLAKIHTWPLYWSFPFGFHLGHLPHLELPLPSQMTMSILKPYSISNYKPEDAGDPEIVKHINDDLLRTMQDELDRLAEGRLPIIGKFGS